MRNRGEESEDFIKHTHKIIFNGKRRQQTRQREKKVKKKQQQQHKFTIYIYL